MASSHAKYAGYVTPNQKEVHTRLHDRMWLLEQYYQEKKSVGIIADEVGCSKKSVENALRHHGIPVKTRSYAAFDMMRRRQSDGGDDE
jgi:predicted DNA-binding protein YlxM (UPF0122 family)